MSSKRQKQVSKVFQEVLSEVFQRDLPHLLGKAFVGVNYVNMSPDLKIATVYLSIFNVGKEELEKIEADKGHIRHLLAQRVKNQMKYVPELRFFIDDLTEYSDNINKIIDSLDIKPDTEEE